MNKKTSQSGIPTDAKIISVLLKTNGISECEPAVIQKLLEFSYRYSVDVLKEATVYMKHSQKNVLSGDDLRLAIQSHSAKNFTPLPSRELLSAVATKINSKTLPQITTKKTYLPPKEQCLLNSEYTLTGLK